MSNTGPHIILAETAPVINAGLTACLARIDTPGYRVCDADTPEHLTGMVQADPNAIVLADPLFGGAFDPQSLRSAAGVPIKIIAIETAPLPRTSRSLYDGTLSINDDLESIARSIAEVMAPPAPAIEEKEALTSREKDIIIHVVKGLTNKEIADKLFLSVHTVMTHRRNIARKLEIHSATGLTIYAIVNGLVDLSEIKL